MRQEQAVTLLRYVRTDKGWTRRRVVEGKTRSWEQRIDRDVAMFGPDVVDLGEYQLRWYERRHGESKARYESAGERYVTAKVAREERKKLLNLVRASEDVGIQPPIAAFNSKPLADQLEPFIKSRRARKKITAEASSKIYRIAVHRFLAITKVRYAEQVNGEILDYFLIELERRGLSDQTQLNNFAAVGAFLRYADERLSKAIRERTPRVAKKNPVSYSEEELDALIICLRSRSRYHRLALAAEMYYKTGLRDRELSHLAWDAVDLERGFIAIKDNRRFSVKVRGEERIVTFRTKNRKDRPIGIPIAAGLLERLREWQKQQRELHPGHQFLFSTANGTPDQTLLAKIRRAVCRAGMNCGACDACRTPCGTCKNCRCYKCKACREKRKCERPHRGEQSCTRVQCKKWRLHHLRHTFATTLVHNGIDLATTKDLLGHDKLTTTQQYLSVAKESKAQASINAVFGD